MAVPLSIIVCAKNTYLNSSRCMTIETQLARLAAYNAKDGDCVVPNRGR
jgi:hypothetical protein